MSYKTQASMAFVMAALLIAVADLTTHGRAAAQSPATQRSAAAAEHSAEGTLNSIDRAKGTVNISHGAVASAQWPAMTMTFKLADPKAAPDISPGQKIAFRFTVQGGMSATVTSIKKVE
jgi:Cu/Ag efflux protein CusF